jgi:hypothetical protein
LVNHFYPALERFKKFCGRAEEAVFLIAGFVSARSQVLVDMLPRQSLASNQKSSLPTATEFFKTL